MLDIKLILDNPEAIAAKLAKKGCVVDFTPLLDLSKKRKELLLSVENAKAERNKLSASVPQVKKEGGDVNAIFAKVKEIAAKSAADEAELAKVSESHRPPESLHDTRVRRCRYRNTIQRRLHEQSLYEIVSDS